MLTLLACWAHVCCVAFQIHVDLLRSLAQVHAALTLFAQPTGREAAPACNCTQTRRFRPVAVALSMSELLKHSNRSSSSDSVMWTWSPLWVKSSGSETECNIFTSRVPHSVAKPPARNASAPAPRRTEAFPGLVL